MNCDAAIFDLDGTILDSLWVWEDISKDFLSKKGKDIPVTYIQELCSKSFQEAAEYTIRLFMLSETSQEVISEWNRLALIEYKHNIKLKKYCLPYLQYLKEEGKKLAIATSLPRILCDSCLISNGIYDMFDVIRSTDEIGRGKNFPDIFEKISDELKVPLSRTLFFDDSLSALVTAKKLGMKVVGVYDKYYASDKTEIIKVAPFKSLVNSKTMSMDEEKKNEIVNLIEFLEKKGYSVHNAHKREAWGQEFMSPEQCTKIDYDEIEKCDIFIAFPGIPASPGTHIEIGWASAFNKKIIFLLADDEEKYAYLVRGLHKVTDVTYIIYHSIEEYYDKLDKML